MIGSAFIPLTGEHFSFYSLRKARFCNNKADSKTFYFRHQLLVETLNLF
jgi:hypothetical protein